MRAPSTQVPWTLLMESILHLALVTQSTQSTTLTRMSTGISSLNPGIRVMPGLLWAKTAPIVEKGRTEL